VANHFLLTKSVKKPEMTKWSYLPTPMLSENLPKIRKLKCFSLTGKSNKKPKNWNNINFLRPNDLYAIMKNAIQQYQLRSTMLRIPLFTTTCQGMFMYCLLLNLWNISNIQLNFFLYCIIIGKSSREKVLKFIFKFA